jgi:hypothetical protein
MPTKRRSMSTSAATQLQRNTKLAKLLVGKRTHDSLLSFGYPALITELTAAVSSDKILCAPIFVQSADFFVIKSAKDAAGKEYSIKVKAFWVRSRS